jgi:ribonuclease BN (tRNA processing enzyme)
MSFKRRIKMTLKFFGNGSGFTNHHTNAYFETDEEVVLIDCSMLSLEKILKLELYKKPTFLFITHMHDDHVSGISLLIQYYYYVYHQEFTIIVPKTLLNDVVTDLTIKGIPKEAYRIITTYSWGNRTWFEKEIPTRHAMELAGCFGYVFNIEGKKVVYTGDTNTLIPFEDELEDADELYVDVSANYGGVHCKFENVKEQLLEYAKHMDVYIMHIDDMDCMENLVKGTPLKIASMIP